MSSQCLVMLKRCPPARVCLPVVKRGEGKGPSLCLGAPGSVSSGCPAGAAARAAWWGELGLFVAPGSPSQRGSMAEQSPRET